MAGILSLLDALLGLEATGVLATLVRVVGSSYRRPGARLLVGAEGLRAGGVSAGCLEQDVALRAREVLAEGRPRLVEYALGTELDLLVGLGNGFDVATRGETTLLAGGGIGVAPLFGLSKRLLAAGKTPVAVLGFNTAEDVFYENEFKALGVQTVIATADGSRGTRGFVIDALPERFDTICACGPMPMLKALCAKTDKPGQISLEARMGCGFGACMGCTIDTVNGPKRVCREGPVFRRDEIKW